MGLEIFKLDGKVAWVTGGAKGLGFAMANALAGVGANIILNSRSPNEAADAAKKIADTHRRRAIGLQADVTRAEDVAAVVARAKKELGGIDILVNNAGINVRLPTVELPVADWQRVVDINLTAPFVCSQAVLPDMIQKKWGRIINMSSILGLVGMAGRPAYGATKGGLILLTRTQALEVAHTGVTVNAICPGPFATDMNKALLDDPEKYKSFVARIPMGRWGELNELDGAVIFLASNASSYITGAALSVDGGWVAQ
jgi:NAD(P)-dependent dehydrogenase (short-subunit alcohol dehydrogenase family)